MKMIAITNRHLVQGNYWQQFEKIAASSVDAIILREKDVPLHTYKTYAQTALSICRIHKKRCILHAFWPVAQELQSTYFHCSLAYLRNHPDIRDHVPHLGVSIHAPEEALQAMQLGATYIIVGHVFPTACKPDSQPVGTAVLQNICQQAAVPIMALGGITPQTVSSLKGLPIAGIAAMSGFMTASNIESYISSLKSGLSV